MRLILSGGGDGPQVKEGYELFAKELRGGKVLYIPLAWNHGNMDECINWLKGELTPFGVTDIEDVLSAKEITKERLSKVSGVFIGGGNTFNLLKQLKDTEAFNNLQEFIQNDGLVMGGSAGALIFGKSIDTCLKDELAVRGNDENLVGLKDTSGFNAVKGCSLFVHYNRKPEDYENTKKKVEKLVKAGHKLICLPEETSVCVFGNTLKIIGQKPAEIYADKFKEVSYPHNGGTEIASL